MRRLVKLTAPALTAAAIVAALTAGAPASGEGAARLAGVGERGHASGHSEQRPRAAPAAERGFDGKVFRLGKAQKQRMRGVSWHGGCPVPLRDLRLLRLDHIAWSGDERRGRLVVHRSKAREILGVFREAYRARFPIRRMKLIDRYGGSDDRSMNADNTSAFNCRNVAGTNRWSQHAYGRAIDVNPVENPYVTPSGHVSPSKGAPYADRSPHRKGMVTRRLIRAFGDAGWEWGGNWSGTKDYQHFSSNGR